MIFGYSHSTHPGKSSYLDLDIVNTFMIELITTNKMLKVRTAMGYVGTKTLKADTHEFFSKHNIDVVRRWADDEDTIVWGLIFPTEQDEFLFKLKYSEYL